MRSDNERRCRRIVETAAPLDVDDLDWDAVGTIPVDGEVLAALVYMRDVEGFTDRDPVGFSAHRCTMADPLVRTFLLDVWRVDEANHTAALDRYLTTYGAATGTPIPPRQPPPPSEVSALERMLAQVGGPVASVVTAAHMAWGAANEQLTLHGYRLLAGQTDDPVLAALLGRISDQEARHFAFYLLQAQWRLAESWPARAVLPRVLRRSWTPVGVGDGYKAQADFDRLVAYLLATGRGAGLAERMDRRFSSLPGFGDLRIFERTVEHAIA
jgi:hypothetical protein